jgi:hypothetical protein
VDHCPCNSDQLEYKYPSQFFSSMEYRHYLQMANHLCLHWLVDVARHMMDDAYSVMDDQNTHNVTTLSKVKRVSKKAPSILPFVGLQM